MVKAHNKLKMRLNIPQNLRYALCSPINELQEEIYNDLEKVLIKKIQSYGLNYRDAKANAELILDYGSDGIYDLALELNNYED